MNTAKKYVLLALSAYQAGKFEEAGALFSQAAEAPDVEELSKELSVSEGSIEIPITPKEDTEGDDDLGDDENEVGEESDDEGLDEEDDDEASTSSGVVRRRVKSLHQIGKILAASLEATASEESDDDDSQDEDMDEEDLEPDPDVPGETMIPASFSSVKVVGFAVNSPVKFKQ